MTHRTHGGIQVYSSLSLCTSFGSCAFAAWRLRESSSYSHATAPCSTECKQTRTAPNTHRHSPLTCRIFGAQGRLTVAVYSPRAPAALELANTLINALEPLGPLIGAGSPYAIITSNPTRELNHCSWIIAGWGIAVGHLHCGGGTSRLTSAGVATSPQPARIWRAQHSPFLNFAHRGLGNGAGFPQSVGDSDSREQPPRNQLPRVRADAEWINRARTQPERVRSLGLYFSPPEILRLNLPFLCQFMIQRTRFLIFVKCAAP